MTETCATASLNIGEDYVNRPDSAGSPPGAVELKIMDPDGNELPAGDVGELWCKGAMNCKGYWNKPEINQSTFQAELNGYEKGPFLRTGDTGFFDNDGELYITGRLKEMIIIRGRNYFPQDVENTAQNAAKLGKLWRNCAFALCKRNGRVNVSSHSNAPFTLGV